MNEVLLGDIQGNWLCIYVALFFPPTAMIAVIKLHYTMELYRSLPKKTEMILI